MATAPEIHVGDVGTIFELTIKDDDGIVDLTGYTLADIYFKKPDGSVVQKTGAVDPTPTTGIVRYTTITGDLDLEGCWLIQAKIGLTGGTWSSDIQQFTVYPNLS
jgi:hypothetical protein